MPFRRHLLAGKAVSAACEEHDITAGVFYQCPKVFLENRAKPFEVTGSYLRDSAGERRVADLEARLRRKDEVVSELRRSTSAQK